MIMIYLEAIKTEFIRVQMSKCLVLSELANEADIPKLYTDRSLQSLTTLAFYI